MFIKQLNKIFNKIWFRLRILKLSAVRLKKDLWSYDDQSESVEYYRDIPTSYIAGKSDQWLGELLTKNER